MMNLWSLLNLSPRMRCYALLDNRGICRALRQASCAPEQNGWVEVSAMHLGWIGQQLPLEAVLRAQADTRRPFPALAA